MLIIHPKPLNIANPNSFKCSFCILFFIFRVYEVRTNSLFWRPVSVSDDVGGDLRKKPQIFSPSLSLPSFSYNIDIFIICQLKVIRGWIQVKKHFTNSVCSLINIKLQKQKFLTHEQRFHCRAVREQGFCPLMLFIHNLDQWTLAPTSWLKRLSSSSPITIVICPSGCVKAWGRFIVRLPPLRRQMRPSPVRSGSNRPSRSQASHFQSLSNAGLQTKYLHVNQIPNIDLLLSSGFPTSHTEI